MMTHAFVCVVLLGACPVSLTLMTRGPSDEIDIVIPASCQKDVGLAATTITMVRRDRDNDELTYTLRAIKKNAPWAHHIYVLQNPSCQEHWQKIAVPERHKTSWINRCSLFPSGIDKLCPTRNSFAVMTVVHRVPNLTSKFIYVEDDDLVIKPTTEDTFYREGLPKCHRMQPKSIYDNPGNTGLSNGDIPRGGRGVFHTWVPLTKDIAQGLEREYPKWFEFVRSHWQGRYSSALNQCGTAESDDKNSLEETLDVVWWLYMQDRNLCSEVSDADSLFQDGRLGSWTRWDEKFNDPSLVILNINDDWSLDEASYQVQHETGIRMLNKAFLAITQMPRPKSKWEVLEQYFPEEPVLSQRSLNSQEQSQRETEVSSLFAHSSVRIEV
eukprot:TRINITY_DN12329_c0_g2_i1.p1 TRINITY_DN12329_c0_g2~~TRINITY_DN12329_c0_g2_i1.p1  ORF type:complete len:383 (-),score=50.39 TRINITY_DN12329_c0_g2_i1:219-1367(-)